MTDIKIAIDVFITMMFVEVIIKPTAIILGKWMLRKADKKVNWIPDWLYKQPMD